MLLSKHSLSEHKSSFTSLLSRHVLHKPLHSPLHLSSYDYSSPLPAYPPLDRKCFGCFSSSPPLHIALITIVYLSFPRLRRLDKVVSFWRRRHALTFRRFAHFYLPLYSSNGRVHKCRWGGGIPQSVIRMTTHTHTHTSARAHSNSLTHSQMHTKKYASVSPPKKKMSKGISKDTYTAQKKKTLHKNIMRIPIHLPPCFTEFPHNSWNSVWCIRLCMHIVTDKMWDKC